MFRNLLQILKAHAFRQKLLNAIIEGLIALQRIDELIKQTLRHFDADSAFKVFVHQLHPQAGFDSEQNAVMIRGG